MTTRETQPPTVHTEVPYNITMAPHSGKFHKGSSCCSTCMIPLSFCTLSLGIDRSHKILWQRSIALTPWPKILLLIRFYFHQHHLAGPQAFQSITTTVHNSARMPPTMRILMVSVPMVCILGSITTNKFPPFVVLSLLPNELTDL